MVLRFFSLNFLLLFIVSCTSNPDVKEIENKDQTEVKEPKSLYIIHCESCHGLDGKKGLSNSADLSKSTFSDSQIKNVILNGNSKGMMPYKDLITNETDIENLVQYVKTLRK